MRYRILKVAYLLIQSRGLYLFQIQPRYCLLLYRNQNADAEYKAKLPISIIKPRVQDPKLVKASERSEIKLRFIHRGMQILLRYLFFLLSLSRIH